MKSTQKYTLRVHIMVFKR